MLTVNDNESVSHLSHFTNLQRQRNKNKNHTTRKKIPSQLIWRLKREQLLSNRYKMSKHYKITFHLIDVCCIDLNLVPFIEFCWKYANVHSINVQCIAWLCAQSFYLEIIEISKNLYFPIRLHRRYWLIS